MPEPKSLGAMNKKPTQLKVIEGNRGKRELPKDEPKPQPTAPPTPKDIDTAAKKTWNRLAPIAERLGLLTEVDGDSFAALCQARSRLLQIWNHLKQIETELKKIAKEIKKIQSGESPTAEDPPHDLASLIKRAAERKERRAYWMKEERMYFASFRTMANDFGFTPRGRVGLSVKPAGKGEKGKDLLS